MSHETTEVSDWIAAESQEQQSRYQRIVADMTALNPEREIWVDAFLAEVEALGFHFHSDQRQRVTAQQLDSIKSRRAPLRVVV